MLKLITSIVSSYWAFAPNGRQLEEIAKGIGKAAKKAAPLADDAARVISKNSDFFQSIPTWVWVVLGIVVVAIILYRVYDER